MFKKLIFSGFEYEFLKILQNMLIFWTTHNS